MEPCHLEAKVVCDDYECIHTPIIIGIPQQSGLTATTLCSRDR